MVAGVLLATSACGSDTAELEQTLDNQAAAQEGIRSRLAEVESRLDAGADPASELGALRRRVDELAATVDAAVAQLREALEAEQTARREAVTPLEAGVGEVRRSVSSLQSQVSELTDGLQVLREDIASLRAQIRNQGS